MYGRRVPTRVVQEGIYHPGYTREAYIPPRVYHWVYKAVYHWVYKAVYHWGHDWVYHRVHDRVYHRVYHRVYTGCT